MNSKWVVVSAIISMRVRKGKQKNIPIYENFYLMEVFDNENIYEKAEKFVLDGIVDDPSLMLDERPAVFCFEGIRKIITVSNPDSEKFIDSRPVNGTELTYSEYIVRNEKQIKKLINGEAVKIRYVE